MPITRLLQAATFNSEQTQAVVDAYESVLAALNLVDRSDPVTELVARTIIDCARTGELDPTRLRDCALAAIMKS